MSVKPWPEPKNCPTHPHQPYRRCRECEKLVEKIEWER